MTKVFRSIHQNLELVSRRNCERIGLCTIQHRDTFSSNFELCRPSPNSLSIREHISSWCSCRQFPTHIPIYWHTFVYFVHYRVQWPILEDPSTPLHHLLGWRQVLSQTFSHLLNIYSFASSNAKLYLVR